MARGRPTSHGQTDGWLAEAIFGGTEYQRIETGTVAIFRRLTQFGRWHSRRCVSACLADHGLAAGCRPGDR
jgi:hypothetical protein